MFKLGKKYVLSYQELKDLREEKYDYFDSEKDRITDEINKKYEEIYKDNIETQATAIKNQKLTIKHLTEDKENALARVEVLEADRDDVRDVIKQSMKNADDNSQLEQMKEDLDEREARLKDRAAKLGTEEDKQYKSGYADGVADGVRKISEITQSDRDNAMKIAMVAASSHTPVENLKELNNVHKLTAGTEDKQA